MRHGYTNSTEHLDSTVIKSYAGPQAVERQEAERRALSALSGVVPVPELVADAPARLVTRFVPGRHGQDLMDDGHAPEVLDRCGRALRLLQQSDPADVFGPARRGGGVVVHGDFGPNNLLFDHDLRIAAILDWEFCHEGDPLEDLAWCEWIVRMHHPAETEHLARLFDAYGSTPPWADRKAAMLQRCADLEDFARDWDPAGGGVQTWVARRESVASWVQ